MLEPLKNAPRRVVGTKQVLRALEKGEAANIFVAEDADEFIYRRIRSAAEEAKVPAIVVPTMAELGKACRVEVGTAAAAILR